MKKPLSEQLIEMYESKWLRDVGTVKAVSRSDASVSKEVELQCEYRMVFDFTKFLQFPITEETDLSSWVDDVISGSGFEKHLDTLLNKEFKKNKWFNEAFDGVSGSLEEVDNVNKEADLKAVALTVKLEFHRKLSVYEQHVAPSLQNIMKDLEADLSRSGKKEDDASKY
jgi:hypothetical protein